MGFSFFMNILTIKPARNYLNLQLLEGEFVTSKF